MYPAKSQQSYHIFGLSWLLIKHTALYINTVKRQNGSESSVRDCSNILYRCLLNTAMLQMSLMNRMLPTWQMSTLNQCHFLLQVHRFHIPVYFKLELAVTMAIRSWIYGRGFLDFFSLLHKQTIPVFAQVAAARSDAKNTESSY